MKTNNQQRLLSLDALRGADMLLLAAIHPVLWVALPLIDAPLAKFLLNQLDHAGWEGFHFWDIIMPLFLFMTGASMPFAFNKYQGRPKAELWRKIIRRTLILFVLGMFVQGNLLTLDPHQFTLYVNTLQSIAVGYFISSILQIFLKPRWQIAATAILLIIYWIPMTFCGNWTPEGNFAYKVDELLMGSWRGDISYTWIWSSLTFAVSVQFGAFSSMIIRNRQFNQTRRFFLLLAMGFTLCLTAYLWSFQMPVIKRLWTCSMTLLAAGYSTILLALLYGWIDVLGHRKGLLWLKVFGMNSIIAYLMGEMIHFNSISESLLYGFAHIVGDWYPVVITTGNSLIICVILYALYRSKVFFKV